MLEEDSLTPLPAIERKIVRLNEEHQKLGVLSVGKRAAKTGGGGEKQGISSSVKKLLLGSEEDTQLFGAGSTNLVVDTN